MNEGFVARHVEHIGSWDLRRRGMTVDLPTHVAEAHALACSGHAGLDLELAGYAVPAFRTGQYDLAVFAALREVEDRVRFNAPGLAALVAVDLMKQAFRTGGLLADPGISVGERTAPMGLFAGAMGVHRNPVATPWWTTPTHARLPRRSSSRTTFFDTLIGPSQQPGLRAPRVRHPRGP